MQNFPPSSDHRLPVRAEEISQPASTFLPAQSFSAPDLHASTVGTSHANPNFSSSVVRSGSIASLDVEFDSNNLRPNVWQTVRGPGVTYSVPFATSESVLPSRVSIQPLEARLAHSVSSTLVPRTVVGTQRTSMPQQSNGPSSTFFRSAFFDPMTTNAFSTSTNMPSSQTVGPFNGGLPSYSNMHPFHYVRPAYANANAVSSGPIIGSTQS
jgi:hypothetical protein